MSTFAELQNRINSDFLNRQYGAETRRAIQAAVRSYERQRWEFNETATSLTTVTGVASVALPDNFLILDDLRITINSENLELIPRDLKHILEVNTTSMTSQPDEYTIYKNNIELAMTPDSVYTLPMRYVKSLPTLSADTDTNAWITGGMEDVIAYHAAKLMWATIIRNDNQAMKFDLLESRALSTVRSGNEQRRVPGRLKATRF